MADFELQGSDLHPGRVLCSNGHENSLGQRFCGECGAPVEPGSSPGETIVPPQAEQRSLRPIALVLAAGLIVAVVASVIVLNSGGGAQDLTGRLVLSGQLFEGVYVDADLVNFDVTSLANHIPRGSGCSGAGGYQDIEDGLDVKVLNEQGTLVGTGRLGPGRVDAAQQDSFLVVVACAFPFTVKDLPEARFYSIEVGHRTGAEYSFQELQGSKWKVSLSLGP